MFYSFEGKKYWAMDKIQMFENCKMLEDLSSKH